MGEHRRWQEVKVWRPSGKMSFSGPVGDLRSDAEVLAEMPAHAMVEELLRRGVLVESRSGAYRLAYWIAKENGDG